jgi:CheY-like chemotaxis protein
VNLLNNAVTFTNEGEVVVLVESQPAGDLYELHFEVRDTGIGIPADRMDRLCRSFSQVDSSSTRRYGGTGLGLAISKQLCEMMGGRVWVVSEVGVGSTFHFTIMAHALPSHAPVQKRDPSLIDLNLLLVDDNTTNLQILERTLQKWGIRTQAVVSAEEALARLTPGHHLDGVFMDYQMPEMDGLSLAHAIRELPHASHLPLVLLTSATSQAHTREIADLKLAACLFKPVKTEQLYETLYTIYAGANQPDQEGATAGAAKEAIHLPTYLRILLAEDNLVNQKVGVRMLERLGYRADVVANGLEALDALKRQPYDLILMDVQMPEMDGLEASRYIRQHYPQEQQPVILAMTAHAMVSARETCLAAGMDGYISKPIRVAELVSALEKVEIRHPAT